MYVQKLSAVKLIFVELFERQGDEMEFVVYPLEAELIGVCDAVDLCGWN